MRIALEQLLNDLTLKTLAFAIALGWSLFQVAQGLATFITTLLQRFDTGNDEFGGLVPYAGGGLAWPIGHRVVAIGQLVAGLVELATVLAVILLVERWSNRSLPGQPVG